MSVCHMYYNIISSKHFKLEEIDITGYKLSQIQGQVKPIFWYILKLKLVKNDFQFQDQREHDPYRCLSMKRK